ncbi:hypothetical protein L1887_18090 [Cichorium endivia]|nr:hypothetical protein L1887_18090 [Cichorium endivia]
MFPSLYNLEAKKKCLVAERITSEGFSWDWGAAIRSREQSLELHNLVGLLGSFQQSERPDQWWCPLAPDGKYYVDVMRKRMDSISHTGDGANIEWIPEVPIKVLCCIWRANIEWIPEARIHQCVSLNVTTY